MHSQVAPRQWCGELSTKRADRPVMHVQRACTPLYGEAQGTPTTPRDDDVMANTFTSLHFHLVFSTKNRAPFLSEEQGGRMQEYLGGCLRELGATPLEIGGVDRKSTRLNSSHSQISYAVFCLKKKTYNKTESHHL